MVKKLERHLSGVRLFGMKTFVFLFVVVAFFRFLLILDLLRPASTCFLSSFLLCFSRLVSAFSSWLLYLLIRVLLEQEIIFQYVFLLVPKTSKRTEVLPVQYP